MQRPDSETIKQDAVAGNVGPKGKHAIVQLIHDIRGDFEEFDVLYQLFDR